MPSSYDPVAKGRRNMISKSTGVTIACVLFSYFLFAQSDSRIRQLAYGDSSRLIEIYKDIHQNPELGFTEVRTSALLARELKSLGFQIIEGLGKTGVAAIMKNGAGPVVMYRADMDALAVKEMTGLPYASVKTVKKDDGSEVPVMHACGHDAHMTWLLGIAKIMVALKNDWKGTLVFIGQPAEELVQGAKAMADDSMYRKGVPVPDFLFGMHTRPIAVGTIENSTGVRFAGTDQLDVLFKGIGGHGSAPELTKDPVVMAATAVMEYQTIISRNIAAQDAAVLTVGAFQSGSTNNIIPPSALLKLNLRWFNDKTRAVLLDGINRINEGIAISYNLPKDMYPAITMKGYATPLINNEQMTNRLNAAFEKIMPAENIHAKLPADMISEDFQLLTGSNKKIVYDYVLVGVASSKAYADAVASGKKYPYFIHNGNYQVDLAAIPFGTLVGATALMELFRK